MDYKQEYSLTVLASLGEVSPSKENSDAIKQIINNWIYGMNQQLSAYPTPKYTLRISGVSAQGDKVEESIFVGINWLGNGKGVSTLADTQIFRLHQLLEQVLNKAS